MIEFSEPESAVAFRRDVRAFLDEQLPPALVEQVYRSGVSHDDGFARAMGERHWLAPELDGEGALDEFEHYVLLDELNLAEAPIYAVETTRMVARVIAAVGSQELREEVIPPAVRGEVTIALGMTEPEAGSDVAAVTTRAVRDGDEWVIDGSKMFTTNGHITDYVFLLARTDPDAPNHRGLTTFLVPLDLPGIEAQGVLTLSGERTNITYYSGVRLDDRWRIGDVDQGWGALMAALQDEHSAPFAAHLDRLLDAAESWARTDDDRGVRPILDVQVQETLARAATDREVAKLLEWRCIWMTSVGEVPVAEGPMSKLFSTESVVEHAERIAEMVGPDALRSRLEPSAVEDGHIEHAVRFAVGTTIYAGTSEIQRNIIARQACGLPR